MKKRYIFLMVNIVLLLCLIVVSVSAASYDDLGWLWPVEQSTQMYRPYYAEHTAIDISPPSEFNSTQANDVVISASRAGTVQTVYDGCTMWNGYVKDHSSCSPTKSTISGTTAGNKYLFVEKDKTSGNVTFSNRICNDGFGKGVIIDHGDGTTSCYAHMNSVSVKPGQQVLQGECIGYMGSYGASTGKHLHFYITVNGKTVNCTPYMDGVFTLADWKNYIGSEIHYSREYHKHTYISGLCQCGDWDKAAVKVEQYEGWFKLRTNRSSAAIRIGPYDSCKQTALLAQGTIVKAVARVKNTRNNYWYKLEDGGYIYSKNVTKSDAPKITLAFSNSGRQVIGTTDATLSRTITVTSGATIWDVSKVGVTVYDTNGTAHKSVPETPGVYNNCITAWYEAKKDLGLVLQPGTTYSYQFYAMIKGETYFSDTFYFTTSGRAPCVEHVKGNYLWPERMHPHYRYWTCGVCGQKFSDWSTEKLADCAQCNVPPASTLSINCNIRSQTMDAGQENALTGVTGSNYVINALSISMDGRTIYSRNPGMTYLSLTEISSGAWFTGLEAGTHTIAVSASDKGGGSASKSVTFTVKQTVKPPKMEIRDVLGGKDVLLSCETSGAEIFYTQDGNDPKNYGFRCAAGTVLHLESSAELRTIAKKDGVWSAEKTQRISIGRTAAPSIRTQKMVDGIHIFLTAASNETIYYSLGGEYKQYSVPIVAAENGMILAYAVQPGCLRSETITQDIEISALDKPTISTPANDTMIPQNTAVLIRWNAVEGAQGYDLIVEKDDEEAVTLFTESENYTYICEQAGVYTFTVQAKNQLFGDSEISAPVSVTSKAPLTVTFVDHDGSLLSSQQVEYGSAATAAHEPSRRGYYFIGWDRSFENVQEDMTVTAQYRIITYSVKFYDQYGTLLSTESVPYMSAANSPENRLQYDNGYAFLGWSYSTESPDSACDYTKVDSNMSLTAIIGWMDAELPVAAEITRAEYDNSIYTIDVALNNTPDKITVGLLRVCLKTSENKLVATEARTVVLDRDAKNQQFSFTINYDRGEGQETVIATAAEALVLEYNDGKTGAAYSIAAKAPISVISEYVYGPASEWSTERPAEQENRAIETMLQYRYRDKQYTTSSNESLSGWTRYNSVTNYGEWINAGWTRTQPTASDTLRITDTRTVTDREAYTVYTYYHWYGYSGGQLYNSYGNLYWKNYESTSSTSEFPYCGTYDGYVGYKATVAGKHGNIWWLESTTLYPAATHTEWYYQTRSASTTHYFWRWGDYSQWSDVAVSSNDDRQVETRTLYRYRDKNIPKIEGLQGAEDTSGVLYQYRGTLPVDPSIDLQGKYATVMVYKGKNTDPNESQLEYLGQTLISSGNTYDVSFKTREEISMTTGDYVVSFGIQGATGLLNNIEIIQAPRPVYEVKFLYENVQIGETQYVEEGRNAAVPDAPGIEGYRFVGWSDTGTNVHSDMVITARYIPETYAVVFVDWVNGTANPYALTYGTDLNEIAQSLIPEAEGRIFKGWADSDGNLVSAENSNIVVRGNAVISAVFEPETFTVRFYSMDAVPSVVSSQIVRYGEAAELPAASAWNGTTAVPEFLGWSTEYAWWAVTCDMDIYPLYRYSVSTAQPVSNIGSNSAGVSEVLTLTAEDGATILYTTDGSEPILGLNAQEYKEPLNLTETTTIKAKAVKENQNASDVVTFNFFYYEPVAYSDADEKVEIDQCTFFAEPGQTIDMNIAITENPGLFSYLFFIEVDDNVFEPVFEEEIGYACTMNGGNNKGNLVIVPATAKGWLVFWYSTEAVKMDGQILSIKLKVNDHAPSGMYTIKLSYSPENTLGLNQTPTDIVCSSKLGGSRILGDVNQDGEVTAADAVKIARYIVQLESLSDDDLLYADVTRDGTVNVIDVIKIARYLIGAEKLS